MEARFEADFVKALKKHASIRRMVKNKVDMILKSPIAMGEPLKGNWQGVYSCPVKRNFIIIYLFCEACRKKGDNDVVRCSDCETSPNQTVKFVLLKPHDQAYGAH